MPPDFEQLDPDYEPGPHARRRGRRHDPWALLLVFCGGLLGTLARYELGLAWTTGAHQFPFPIFVINASGAFLLGALLAWPRVSTQQSGALRLFVGTGVLGGWTTYSSLVLGALTLGHRHEVGLGCLYLGATVLAGLVATGAGRHLHRTPRPEGAP
jgi:fluoride exporter